METMYRNFKLSSVYKGDKDAGWSKYPNYNNHIITVRNIETGKYTRFEFWESVSEKEIRTKEQLLWAFRCFVDDAISGEYDIDDFFAEFGYYDHAKEGLRAWKGCQIAKRKAKRVLDCDLYELINQMGEDGIE